MQVLANGDYCLHIDTDERFDIMFLSEMRNLVQSYLDRGILPILFRFQEGMMNLI